MTISSNIDNNLILTDNKSVAFEVYDDRGNRIDLLSPLNSWGRLSSSGDSKKDFYDLKLSYKPVYGGEYQPGPFSASVTYNLTMP